MYIGAWQEYHLSRKGGSIAGATGKKATSNSLASPSSSAAIQPRKRKDSIDLEDMRAALLLSLDAETTRRAMAAIEMTRASPTAEEKMMADTNNPRRSMRKLVVPKKKPLVREPVGKLPPLLALQNKKGPSPFNPHVYSGSSYSANLGTMESPYGMSSTPDSNDKHGFSTLNDIKGNLEDEINGFRNARNKQRERMGVRSSYGKHLEPLNSVRSSRSEPTQPTKLSTMSSSFHHNQRLNVPTVSPPSTSSTSIRSSQPDTSSTTSAAYDTTAVMDILRATRKVNRPNFKEFFGKSGNSNSNSSNGGGSEDQLVHKVSEVDRRIDGVKRMQQLYVMENQQEQNNDSKLLGMKGVNSDSNREGYPQKSLSEFTTDASEQPLPKTPKIGDFEVTDNELSLISKYFMASANETDRTDLKGGHDSDDSKKIKRLSYIQQGAPRVSPTPLEEMDEANIYSTEPSRINTAFSKDHITPDTVGYAESVEDMLQWAQGLDFKDLDMI